MSDNVQQDVQVIAGISVPGASSRDKLKAEAVLAKDLLYSIGADLPARLDFLNGRKFGQMSDAELLLVRDLGRQTFVEESEKIVIEKRLQRIEAGEEPCVGCGGYHEYGENDADFNSRDQVYAAIDQERDYQDNVVKTDPKRFNANSTFPHSVGDYLTLLSTYLRKAQDDWSLNAGVEASLHQVRKIAAIAVHCMEDHGAPLRTCDSTFEPHGKPIPCARSYAHEGHHESKNGYRWGFNFGERLR